jgi:hypothetical protein
VHAVLVVTLAVLCSGCEPAPGPAGDPELCSVRERERQLPEEVRETSGIAISSFDASVLWTHNDRNNTPELFAVDGEGRLAARRTVAGAKLVDWEDMDRAACDAGSCLYIGDIGDNSGNRDSITIYEVTEPGLGRGVTDSARAFVARYPDGPQDAESLFVTETGDIYIITKGRHAAVTLYRLPHAARGRVTTLEHVVEIAPQPHNRRDWVTGATLSPDGAWVLMRTYRTLFFLPARALLAGDIVEPLRYDLTPLGERQGEAVAMAADGTVWLTSEAENRRLLPTRARLHCVLPVS